MTIGLGHYLSVAAILFTFGIFGIFLNRKNVIIILMSIELILLAVNINFVAFSAHLGDIMGQVFALLVLTVAAAEAAIGLAILVVYFRNRGSIAVEDMHLGDASRFAAVEDVGQEHRPGEQRRNDQQPRGHVFRRAVADDATEQPCNQGADQRKKDDGLDHEG